MKLLPLALLFCSCGNADFTYKGIGVFLENAELTEEEFASTLNSFTKDFSYFMRGIGQPYPTSEEQIQSTFPGLMVIVWEGQFHVSIQNLGAEE